MRPAQYSVKGFMASSTPFFTASKSWKSPTTSCAPNGWKASSPPVFSTMPLHQSLQICSPTPPGQAVWIFQIGRASCRERVCQYVEISVDAVSLKKKQQLVTQTETL